jgi:ABC-2 type transport system permease protein
MTLIWTLAKKEFLLLVRDRLALILLLVMPVLFIAILGLLLGEGFGQKADDSLRVSIVDRDRGPGIEGLTWAQVVQRDLAETAGIKVEIIKSPEEAETLIRDHKRAAVLIFEPTFSEKVSRCSFLADGINPFHRDGVDLQIVTLGEPSKGERKLDALLLKDSTQGGAASIIEQVAQVTMLRVILPWMIGRAFERLSDPRFITILGNEVNLPAPMSEQELRQFLGLYGEFEKVRDSPVKMAQFAPRILQALGSIPKKGTAATNAVSGGLTWAASRTHRVSLGDSLRIAAMNSVKNDWGGRGADGIVGTAPRAVLVEMQTQEYRKKVGNGVQAALGKQFEKYNLRGMTWADLTKSKAEGREGAAAYDYVNRDGGGLLKRGAYRYQVLVPSYTVMFAFFLALIVGWVFVAERRQGTLKRLRAAPVTPGHILLGKMLPCYVLSVIQGLFLLVMGRLLFGMRWGPEDWPLWQQGAFLLPVVMTTSLAVVGLAMLVAVVARSEMQVALLGAVTVLVLALIGGCVLPRDMMPEQTREISLLTPHGQALDAYRELLISEHPNLDIVGHSCRVLIEFGLAFLLVAWGMIYLGRLLRWARLTKWRMGLALANWCDWMAV